MFKVRQFLFLQFSPAAGGTAFPPVERAILAAFMVGNPLRSAKTSSINRNFMTRETTSSGGTLYFPTNPVQPNCSRVFVCPYVDLFNFVFQANKELDHTACSWSCLDLPKQPLGSHSLCTTRFISFSYPVCRKGSVILPISRKRRRLRRGSRPG